MLSFVLLLPSCASWQQNRWLQDHRKNLTRIASSSLPAEQKLDGLLQDYVQFMKEDLKFVNPAKGVKYVQKYHDQNQAAMEKILREAEAWQGKLSVTDRLALGVRVAQKPYLKDLVDLAPKFKRKYQQYAFAVKLASRLSGGLFKFLGKDLF
ncbi:MAG TPA: hypothetical protein PKD78_08065 [Saprospiraceae bacterium]|nr:hypothetical protein [Saprospiraceae bacterium]